MLKGIGHIGIIVEDIETTLKGLANLLGVEKPAVREVVEKRMKIALIDLGPIQLELLQDLSEDGWIAQLVKQRGTGLHHLCIVSDDLEGDLEQIKARGVEMSMEEPALGLRGKRIIFTKPETVGGVAVELSEP